MSLKVWEKFDPNSAALKAQQASERKKFAVADENGDGFLDAEEAPCNNNNTC